MPVFTRTKRVTDPLDDRVKDRIIGRGKPEPAYVSSGSEHSAGSEQHYDDSSFDCFFLNEEEDGENSNANGDFNGDNDDRQIHDNETDSDPECDSDRTDTLIENLTSVFSHQNVDRFRNVLLSNVLKAIEIYNLQYPKPNRQIVNRNVMLYLQNIGFNAAICKTKWQSCGGLTSGNYEFIDVIRSENNNSSSTRYFIDVNFAGEFDIARETTHFRRVSNKLPTVFVGKSEDLKQIVKLLSDATRRSLRSRGLLLPPWRKNRFMQNKWFGPYRRTVNYMPKSSTVNVKCQSIGFDTVSKGLTATLLPAATRTR